jgi:hypothetical protein
MKHCLPTVLISLAALFAGAQTTFVKGYIVNEKGDTVRGEAKVNPKKEIDSYNKIFFKEPSGVQKNYKPNKISAYGVGAEHFRSMDSEGEKKFYKVLATGDINFFKLGYEGLRMNEVVFETEYYISDKDSQELVLVKEGKFKKQMTERMKDNPEFINTYGDDKKFDPEKATEIITQYNSWKAGK